MRKPAFALAAALLSGCGGGDTLELTNRLDTAVGLEVRAPRADLEGDCGQDLQRRFCADEYEIVGVLDYAAGESRPVVLSDGEGGECARVLWLRLVWLGDPDGAAEGPAQDPGTLLALPAAAEIEEGAGALHTAAFPGRTVRIDQVGPVDAQQARPPEPCPTP